MAVVSTDCMQLRTKCLISFQTLQEEYQKIQTLQVENQKCLPSCIPGLGLLLVGLEVFVFQGGSVLAKSLATNPLLMLLLRDILQFSFQVKFSKFSTYPCTCRCPQLSCQAKTLFLEVAVSPFSLKP